jgi:hypothetical protein
MKINFDNQQYKQFTDFAARASDRTIVKIGRDTVPADGEGGLATRSIVAKSWDFIGNIGRLSSSSSKNDAVRELFKSTILQMFGVSDETQLPEPVQTAMKLDDYGKGKPLSARRIKAVKVAMDQLKEVQDFADNAVAGSGAGAKQIRDTYVQLATKVRQVTGRKIPDIRNAAIIGHANRSVCDECKKLAANDELSTFPLDIVRRLKVTLPNGKQLSRNFEKARDELAAFVTGDPAAKYDGLTDKKAKGKVLVLMALLNQRIGQGLLNADGLALDPDGRTSRVFFGGRRQDDTAVRYEYSISFGQDGTLAIKGNVVQEGIDMVMVTGDLGNDTIVSAGPGTKVEAGLELKIAPDELDRLAGLDYSKYDNAAVEAKSSDPAVKNRFSDTSLLGKDFMFAPGKVTCTSTYKLTVAG